MVNTNERIGKRKEEITILNNISWINTGKQLFAGKILSNCVQLI